MLAAEYLIRTQPKILVISPPLRGVTPSAFTAVVNLISLPKFTLKYCNKISLEQPGYQRIIAQY